MTSVERRGLQKKITAVWTLTMMAMTVKVTSIPGRMNTLLVAKTRCLRTKMMASQ